MGEELHEYDRVGGGGQGGVGVKTVAEGRPDIPDGIGCGVSFGGDSQGDIVDDSAEIIADTFSLDGWTIFQQGSMGKLDWMAWSNSWSDKEKEREQKSASSLDFPGTETGCRVRP